MIRSYRESDLAAVISLFTQSVHGLACAHYDAKQLAIWAPQSPDQRSWELRLAKLTTLVADANMELAGFISYERKGHVDLLYVSPAYARRGVASDLYHAAEANLRSEGISELFTEASEIARPFFLRQGFQVTEEQNIERNGVAFRRYGMRKTIVAR